MIAGRAIKRVREEAGIRGRELARRSGLTPSRLSRIENGRAQPRPEELASILGTIDTDLSRALIRDLERPLVNVAAPRWEELTSDDQEALREADVALEKLNAFRVRPSFPEHLAEFVASLGERLISNVRLLGDNSHPLVFIGPLMVGKSTAINSLFKLTIEFTRRGPGGRGRFKVTSGLLPIGSARTTAFEYRVMDGPDIGIRVEPEDQAVIERDVRSICAYWFERIANEAQPDRTISEEGERLYRRMADLIETEDGPDPMAALISPGVTLEQVVLEFKHRLNLKSRTKAELSFAADRAPRQSEGDWLQKSLRDLNNGRLPDSPLPKRLTMVAPNPLLIGDGTRPVIVDTRGIEETPLGRGDLTGPAEDPKAILVLCTGFSEAHPHVRELIQHIHDSDSDALSSGRVVLLVLDRAGEAEGVTMPDGDPAGDKDRGRRQREVQIKRQLGDSASKIPALFFDSASDDPSATRRELFALVDLSRDVLRRRLRSLCDSVDSLLDNQQRAEFLQTQRLVAEKIDHIYRSHQTVPPRRTSTRLIRHLMDVAYASSLWSVTRNQGYGRSINLYELFGSLVREDSATGTAATLHGLRELLEDLKGSSRLRGPHMRKSRQYVSEVMEAFPEKHREFLRETRKIGETTLEMFLELQAAGLWGQCVAEWATGVPGYKPRVGRLIQDWFDSHEELDRQVTQRIQAAWEGTFMGWLRGYTAVGPE